MKQESGIKTTEHILSNKQCIYTLKCTTTLISFILIASMKISVILKDAFHSIFISNIVDQDNLGGLWFLARFHEVQHKLLIA